MITALMQVSVSVPLQITLGVLLIIVQVSWFLGYLGKFDYFIQPQECSHILCAHNLIMRMFFYCLLAFLNVLILSMYDVSWGDGWNDLSMSIGLTRYRPDSDRTWDRMTYSQFLNIVAKLPVGHDDTMIASFDIPCKLWPVVASLLFAGICFIYIGR